MNDSDRCSRCFLPIARCMCAEIRPVDTRTRIVIVRHRLERYKNSNTGRLAAMALRRCTLLEYADPDRPLDTAELGRPGTWLMFPEGKPADSPPAPLPSHLVVLDATWSQARRMRQRIAALRGLPVLSLPARRLGHERLRRAPAPNTMSSIEALAAALRLLEGNEPADELLRLYNVAVDRFALSNRR